MATTYRFKFTDSLKNEVIVSEYTANGWLTPTSTTLMPNASRADFSIKLYGKGMPEYGEGIEQNLIYMLENFAGSIAPNNPIEGQIWYNRYGSPEIAEVAVFNGSDWSTRFILNTGTSSMTGNLDLGNNRIVNVSDPIDDTDALNLQTGNTLYVNVSGGDTILDNILLQDSLGSPASPLSPTDPAHIVNWNFVENNYLNLNGGTLTGPLILPPNTSSPLNPNEAATIKYVNDAIASSSDTYLQTITYGVPTGAGVTPSDPTQSIFYNLSNGTSIELDGVSLDGHTHSATEVYNTGFGSLPAGTVQASLEYLETNKISGVNATLYGNTTIAPGGTLELAADPTSANQAATKSYVDSLIRTNSLDIKRKVLTSDGGTLYRIPYFVAGKNKTIIYLNGIKQYNNTNAYQDILYDTFITDTTLTGLLTSPSGSPPLLGSPALGSGSPPIGYDFQITTNAGTDIIYIDPNVDAVSTHRELVDTINSKILTYSAYMVIEDGIERFYSYDSGSSAFVNISDPGTQNYYLFAPGILDSFNSLGTPVSGADYDYAEGFVAGSPPAFIPSNADALSDYINFNSTFPAGELIEVIIMP